MSQLQVTKITTVDNTTPLILATGNAGGGQIIVQSSNTDVFFNGNLRLSSFVTGDGSGLLLPSSNVANAAFNTANAAYASANNVAPQVTPAFNTANSAYDTANAAFASANNVAPQVTPSFNTANSAFATANIASNTAIAAYNDANAAYSQANAAYSHANTKFSSSGGSITGAVEISGDLTVRGNTRFIDQQTLAIGDSLIYLAANNYSSDVVDIGFVANYVNTGGSNVHTGLYRSSGNKEYYLFQGYDKEPYNNYIDPVGNNFTLAVLNADIITNNLFLGGANAINWIGSAFAKANASGANVGQTAPTGVTSGKLWWNSDLGKLFVYYTDPANTSSWIETSPSASAIEGSIITGYINPVFNTVNAAFGKANTALQNTSGTFAGTLSVTGNVGIGTSSAANKLHVVGGGFIQSGAINTELTPSYSGTWFAYDGSNNVTVLQSLNASGSGFSFHTKSGAGVAPTEGMKLTATNYLGIGLNGDPQYPLQVRRGGNGSLGINFDNYLGISDRTVKYHAIGDVSTDICSHAFFVRNATATDNLSLFLKYDGNVGVGTSAPASKFHVSVPYAGNNAVQIGVSGQEQFVIYPGVTGVTNASLSVKDITTPYDYVTFRQGRIGIGTNDPSYKLHISHSGTSYVWNTNSAAGAGLSGFVCQNSGDTRGIRINGSNFEIYDFSAGVVRQSINSSGHILNNYQPYGSVTWTGTLLRGNVIPFNTANQERVGGLWNTSTYRFTAPVAGYYLFTCIGKTAGTGGLNWVIYLQHNGSNVAESWGYDNTGGKAYGVSLSHVRYLAASDYVQYYFNHDSGSPAALAVAWTSYALLG